MSDLVAARSPIALCHPDILLTIFELTVEEEKEGLSEQLLKRLRVVPKTPSTLALVCRHWKNLIYDTGYFWAVVSIDASVFAGDVVLSTAQHQHTLVEREHVQKRAKMAKNAPVDLYITNFFQSQDLASISSILGVATNIVKLYVESKVPTTPTLLTRQWPELAELREAAYIFHLLYDVHIDISHHLRGMPNLTALRIVEPGFTLTYCTGIPLLPVLKKLRLEATANLLSHTRTSAAAFISHCPQLEELYLGYISGFTMEYDPSAPSLTLACLRRLSSSGMSIMDPFVTSFFKTPVLQNLDLPMWVSSHESGAQALLEANAPTITTLSLTVRDESHYRNSMLPLLHLTSLTLVVYGGKGGFLTPLYAPREDVSSAAQYVPKYLPSLHVLRLVLLATKISSEHFSRFATARCIPVDGQRMTEAGYKALENVQIMTDSPNVGGAMGTAAWQVANVNQAKGNSFELRWDNPLV